MKEYVEGLEREFSAIERGFLREQRCARSDYASFDSEKARRVAFLAYRSEAYPVRMYAVFLLGHLSQESDVLSFLRDDVSADSNWRVQEVLAKAFEDFCAVRGYEAALPVIDEWLSDPRPGVRRAVTEGLRIWTNRPYFRDPPAMLSQGCRGCTAIQASTFANPWETRCGTSVRKIRSWLRPNWRRGTAPAGKPRRSTAWLPHSSSARPSTHSGPQVYGVCGGSGVCAGDVV